MERRKRLSTSQGKKVMKIAKYVTENIILSYLEKSRNGLSIGEAFINYQLSGGHITKIISNLRKEGHKIETKRQINPVTGRRFARYILIEKAVKPQLEIAF